MVFWPVNLWGKLQKAIRQAFGLAYLLPELARYRD
jgi:hypothetical protein